MSGCSYGPVRPISWSYAGGAGWPRRCCRVLTVQYGHPQVQTLAVERGLVHPAPVHNSESRHPAGIPAGTAAPVSPAQEQRCPLDHRLDDSSASSPLRPSPGCHHRQGRDAFPLVAPGLALVNLCDSDHRLGGLASGGQTGCLGQQVHRPCVRPLSARRHSGYCGPGTACSTSRHRGRARQLG